MAAFRLRKPGGGSAIRGGDGFRGSDAQVFAFNASGGLALGGEASAQFRSAVIADHGGGYFPIHTTGLPILRWQLGEPQTFKHTSIGGIVHGGTARTAFQSNEKPLQRKNSEALLLLMAA